MFKPFLTKWPFLFKFRLILASILLILLALVLYFKIVPFGHISYSQTWPRGFGSGKGFIYDFKPAERMSIDDKGIFKVLADPIYFSLFTPRSFDKAKVTIKYRDKLDSNTPILEMGVLRDKVTGSYDLRPISNKIIDGLLGDWKYLKDSDGTLIITSGSRYTKAQEFWSDFSSNHLDSCEGKLNDCVALYNYHLDQSIPDNLLDFSISPLVISQPWRGAHDFYVYLPGGPWWFDFDFVDLNQDKASDPISLKFYSGADIIAEKFIADENAFPDSGRTEDKSLSLSGKNLKPGIYKMSIGISDDMVIAKITSPSDKMAFINKIWPVSGQGGLSIFTDVTNLQARTLNPASLGIIDFGGKKFPFDKAYQLFNFSSTGGIQNIKLKSDDIMLAGNGVFALSRQGLINPSLAKIDQYWRPSESVKYIVANYESPRIDNEDKIAEVEFNLQGASRSDGRYTFLLSIPGLSGNMASSSYLEIKEIKVDLVGKNIWQKIISLISK